MILTIKLRGWKITTGLEIVRTQSGLLPSSYIGQEPSLDFPGCYKYNPMGPASVARRHAGKGCKWKGPGMAPQ